MRNPSFFPKALLTVTLASLALPAMAFWGDGRNTTTIEGPGFKTESHNGLFGSGNQSYQDALGNHISSEKNWFGRRRTDTSVFGATVRQSRNNTQITAPNGTPILERRRGWFGGQETHINTNSLFPLFTSFPGMFNPSAPQARSLPPQSTLPYGFSRPIGNYQVFPTQSYANSFQPVNSPSNLIIPNGLNQTVPFITPPQNTLAPVVTTVSPY